MTGRLPSPGVQDRLARRQALTAEQRLRVIDDAFTVVFDLDQDMDLFERWPFSGGNPAAKDFSFFAGAVASTDTLELLIYDKDADGEPMSVFVRALKKGLLPEHDAWLFIEETDNGL